MAVRRLPGLLLVAALLAGAPGPSARAEYGRTPTSDVDPATLAIDEARFIGTPLPGDLALVGEDGRRFELRELFGKPVVLLFSYYSCDGACPAVNRKLAEAIAGTERFRAGSDYRVLTLSFDPKDSPGSLRRFVQQLGPGAQTLRGWRFALFADSGDTRRIAHSVGYRWFWSLRDRVFVHPNTMIVLGPDGRVVRYLPSWSITPRDLDLALVESDWMRVSNSLNVIDIATGICFSYSYKEGRYVLNLPLFVAAGSLTLGFASIVGGFAVFRRSRQRKEVQHA